MANDVKLTAMTKAAGCAAKLSPSLLDSALGRLPKQVNANVLVGFETRDDAGVYRLSDSLALVQTVDFFTPIVDDPYLYGQISAANALSDIYAMGGKPISALTVVGFPRAGDVGLLEKILRGGLAKMEEAGCAVIGGHSIGDEEIKFGYAVTGLIDPQRVWKNVGARPGDMLILTKPLGTGVISTALKKSRASQRALAASSSSMLTLNRAAAEALAEFEGGIHAVTDITGFGLLGHAHEMAVGSGVSLAFDHRGFAFFEDALEYAREGHLAGGLKNNREYVGECAQFDASVLEEIRALLFDPQTSGGLLVAMDEGIARPVRQALEARGVSVQRVGRVLEKRSPLMVVS